VGVTAAAVTADVPATTHRHAEIDRISALVSARNMDKWSLLADIRFRPNSRTTFGELLVSVGCSW